jgi:hypothetical protein
MPAPFGDAEPSSTLSGFAVWHHTGRDFSLYSPNNNFLQ